MIDLPEHERILDALLRRASPAQGNRYAAWCCFALACNASAVVFLEKQDGGTGRTAQALGELDRAWAGLDPVEAPLDALQQVDWDPDDVDMHDEAAAQGATDLLAALKQLVRWRQTRDVAALAACAELVINAIDYLEGFELIDPSIQRPVDGELEAQKQFAQELLAGTIRETDRLKFHEWLIAATTPRR